jgi:hypothetical protein
MRRFFPALLLCLALSACSTQSVVLQNSPPVLKQDEMQHFFVSGLGQTQSVNAADVCGGTDRVAKVERVESGLNIFLGFITNGIYTPYTAKVYCSD